MWCDTSGRGRRSTNGNIGNLIRAILPAIQKTKNAKGDPVDNAARENVRLNIKIIKSQSHVLEEMVNEGKVATAGAYYDLDSGKVEFFPSY